ncbi:alpha/beta hydrolase fold domain-containing protein [Nocardia transvalensis]|uniref:alpha/beta hydrolase fold domain-containing protein n=1 Tax=Nocardia transvalensis TaxID=37333 RepID=UPI0018933580|nr:alpha/beta hydrolase [Nocardia transvalensis]MBF6331296.1 alpha/beta hydrolase [Nocardia transvalensis]
MTVQSESERPPAPTGWSPGRTVLLLVAAVLGLLVVLAQVFAIAPVSWTQPLLRTASVQSLIMLLGWVRDVSGSWNLIFAALAVLLAVLALRIRRSGPARAVTAVTAVGLVLALITTVGLAWSAHRATGRWILFGPALPGITTGRGPDRTVTYATLDGEQMKADLYLPADASGPVPVVVRIHGGGFIGGSRGPTPYNSWLADRGYAFVDVDYRLSNADRLRWNTQDADVGCALTWVAAHAQEYHWDLNRLATFGDSAGGNLAINVAYKIANGTLHPSCGSAAELPKVRAAIADYPAVDLTGSESDTAEGAHVGREYLGGPASRFPERYAATDSAPQIGPNSPPTLLLQGKGDHLVFASRARAFIDKLTAAGVVNRYVELPFLDHGYDGVLNTGAQIGRDVVLDWLRRYDA